MKLKYAADLQFIKNCPPANAESREVTAYRLVHNPIRDADFLPIAKTDPARFPPGTDRHCYSFAVSLFDTFASIRRKFGYVARTNPNILKDVGSHIARGEIEEADGLSTPPSRRSGHISLFESEECVLTEKFDIAEALLDDTP